MRRGRHRRGAHEVLGLGAPRFVRVFVENARAAWPHTILIETASLFFPHFFLMKNSFCYFLPPIELRPPSILCARATSTSSVGRTSTISPLPR